MDDIDDSGFYEDDEPVENILAILDRAPDGVTEPPPGVGVVLRGSFGTSFERNRVVERPGVRVS